MEAHGVFLADDDVASRTHRARDHRLIVTAGHHGALARHPDVMTEVVLLLSEVVVRIDTLELERVATVLIVYSDAHDTEDPVHHLVPVVKGKLLRPVEVAQV